MSERILICADLGGYSISFARIRAPFEQGSPNIECRVSHPTPSDRAVGGVVSVLADTIAGLARGGEFGVCIAMPGMLDASRRRPLAMANFPTEWQGLDVPCTISAALSELGIDMPVRIENDANCQALGEGFAGAALGASDFVVLTLDAGIGCGIVTGGALLTGSRGMAGEAGHMVVCGDACCACGGKGHSETLAAADGTALRAKDAALAEDFAHLWQMRHDKKARRILEPALDALARTIASVMHLLDPEAVILAGEMSQAEGIGDEVADRTKPYLASAYRNALDIRISTLGRDAALYGAAAVALGDTPIH